MMIETSLDWQKTRVELIKMAEGCGKYQRELKKIVNNLDDMIAKLSTEEVQCRRQQKQTKRHQEILSNINQEINNYEQMITFGTLLNG